MFDYQYMTQNTHLTLTISGTNGKVRDITIDKDEDEDIGIQFENGLMISIVTAAIIVYSVLSIRIPKVLERLFISRMTMPDSHFFREIISLLRICQITILTGS